MKTSQDEVVQTFLEYRNAAAAQRKSSHGGARRRRAVTAGSSFKRALGELVTKLRASDAH